MTSSARSIFLAHVETLKDGSLDASGILSKRCFDEWVRTRRKPPDNAPQGFRNALKTVLLGSHRVLPLPAEVEAALLPHLREKRRWPCFHNTESKIGARGWNLRCYHESKVPGSESGLRLSGLSGAKGLKAESEDSAKSVSKPCNVAAAPTAIASSEVGSARSGLSKFGNSGVLAVVGKFVGASSTAASALQLVIAQGVTDEESTSSRRARKRSDRGFASDSSPPAHPRQSANEESDSVALVMGPPRADAAYETFERLCAFPEAAFAHHAGVVPQLLLPTVGARFDDLVAQNDVRLQDDFIFCPPSCSFFAPMQPVYGVQTLYRDEFAPPLVTSCEAGAKGLFGADVVGRAIPMSEIPVYNAFVMGRVFELGLEAYFFAGNKFWSHMILRREGAPPCVVRYSEKLLRFTEEGFAVIGVQAQDVSALFPDLLLRPSMFPELLSS